MIGRVLLFVGLAIVTGIGLLMALGNLQVAQKQADVANAEVELAQHDLAYEYGKCVFYYQAPLGDCNAASADKGLALYEKYYGDGSWTVEADPIPP